MIRAIYFLIFLYGCSMAPQEPIEVVDATKLMELKSEGVLVVDIRTKDEYDQGHIAGVKHIDFYRSDFMEAMSELDKNSPLIIHCAKGGRSGKASKKLKEAGFMKIYDYTGGYTDWLSKGLEIEK